MLLDCKYIFCMVRTSNIIVGVILAWHQQPEFLQLQSNGTTQQLDLQTYLLYCMSCLSSKCITWTLSQAPTYNIASSHPVTQSVTQSLSLLLHLVLLLSLLLSLLLPLLLGRLRGAARQAGYVVRRRFVLEKFEQGDREAATVHQLER
jgi:hypothetical protein